MFCRGLVDLSMSQKVGLRLTSIVFGVNRVDKRGGVRRDLKVIRSGREAFSESNGVSESDMRAWEASY